jgi:sulfhydrogenase subunit gamma (sulfur reductase)
MSADIHIPREAVITERIQDSHDTFTMRLSISGEDRFSFEPGQFNMLYLYGVGEVPISIVPDPGKDNSFDHTIRVVGRVTTGLEALQPGTRVGIRGPFGRGWPVDQARGDDLLLVTGGLGSAPLVSVIDRVMANRSDYGRLYILHGVKQDTDLMWQERYREWDLHADNTVLLTADVPSPDWPWFQGTSVDLFSKLEIDPGRTTAMLCGPEVMMLAAIEGLRVKGLADHRIWLSMERNMQCGIGRCGHCQAGPKFVCKDGPVFCVSEISGLLGVRGI